MKSLFPLIAGSVLSILILFFWTSPQASAASPLDGAYQTTDQLLLQKNGTTPAVDVSTTYNNLIDGILPEGLEGNSIRYFKDNDNITSNAALVQELRDSWNLTKQNWSISQFMQYTDLALTHQFLVLNYTCDESLTVNFQEDINFNTGRVFVSSSSANSCKKRITINWYNGLIDIKQTTMNSVITDSSISGHYSDVYIILNYLTFATTINYPTGYDGELIRDHIITPNGFKPSINWSVDTTGVLRASYADNGTIKLNGYGNYRIFKQGVEWATPPDEFLDQGLGRPFWQYKYEYDKLPEAGYYALVVSYDEGEWEVAPPDFTHVETQYFKIYWDGKSFIQGNNEECGDSENPCNNTTGKNPFLELLTENDANMYGIQAVVTAPLSFITSLISYQNTCSPLSLPLPYMDNKSLVIPCMTPIYQNHFLPLLELYQSVMIALVSYYVFIKILHSVKDAQDPHINRIEVVKL